MIALAGWAWFAIGFVGAYVLLFLVLCAGYWVSRRMG